MTARAELVRGLTVQQPWAWAIVNGGKSVENRTQLWSHRGPLAIHAGSRLSERGCNLVPDLLDLSTSPDVLSRYASTDLVYSAIIGMADVVDAHQAEPECCESVWAEQSYVEHGGKVRNRIVHLVLENARPLATPIPCSGMLGLWRPPHDVLIELADQGHVTI